MSVDKISIPASMCICATSDYEGAEIARRLRALGIEPTGDKQANKAKLHEIEVKIARGRNEPLGGLLTVSYAQEQEIISAKKEKLYGSLNNYKKEKNNNKKNPLEAEEILGQQKMAIIELKRREAKDRAKSDKLRLDKPAQKVKPKRTKQKEIIINPQISPDTRTETKEISNS